MLSIYSELPIAAQSAQIRMPLIMESKSCDEIFGCSVSAKARWTTSLFPSPHSEKENHLTEKSLVNFQHSDREPKSPLLTQGTRMSAGVYEGDLTLINAAMRETERALPRVRLRRGEVALACHLAGNEPDLAESLISGEHARESDSPFHPAATLCPDGGV